MKDWGLSFENHSQAKIFLQLLNDEYDFTENDDKNILGKRDNFWINDSDDNSDFSDDDDEKNEDEKMNKQNSEIQGNQLHTI